MLECPMIYCNAFGFIPAFAKLVQNTWRKVVEYEKLQEQREVLYADDGKLKKQVKEYDVIKQNIDSILRQPREPERKRQTQLE